ncbi:MAG: hypothetical protein QOH06_1688 [Acidobacteriota bacterium]|jgi:hypothetical protein|nr:hypothetical protein [Acidobacteriota bacterium]
MKTRNPLTLLGGVGLGAGLMYLLDPDGGRRRRALARDKAVHGLKVSGKALRRTSADVGNRTRGLVAGAGSLLRKGSKGVHEVESRLEIHDGESESSNGSRRLSPRTAALGLGGVGALAGLGLLARSKGGNLKDLTRPLRETRGAKGKQPGQQLEW